MPGLLAFFQALAGRSDVPTAADPSAPVAPAAPPVHPTGLDGAEVVRRALSAVGHGTYRLGKGGRRPHDPAPFDAGGFCDCSGFASWCLGVDRYQPTGIDGGWISTDSIVRDARGVRPSGSPMLGPRRMFREVEINEALPGDLVVYPGSFVAGRRVGIGHVGVIVEPGPTILACRVAHCAASKSVGAVRVSDGRPWARRGIVVRRA